MPRRTFAECIAQWNLLKQGLDANATDLAFLETERGQFTTSLARVGTLDARREALKA